MMQINGKTYHTLEEAAELTGYTKGTIYSYISAGTINGERMEDGQWFVSEVGMVQLKRRKKIPITPEVVPETNHIAEASKLVSKPSKISDCSDHLSRPPAVVWRLLPASQSPRP